MNLLDKIRRRGWDAARIIDELVDVNQKLQGDFGGAAFYNKPAAVQTARQIRATLAGYGLENDAAGEAVAAGAAHQIMKIQSAATAEWNDQQTVYGRSVDSRILAAQKLAEDAELEGDVFAAVIAPIELGMDSRVWISGGDQGMVKQINGLLNAWNVMETICAAWHDLETYSAFYVTHDWKEGVPTPIHWSPKRISVGPTDTGYGVVDFVFLPTRTEQKPSGEEMQTQIDFFKTATGGAWNEWGQNDFKGYMLKPEYLSWGHLFKHKHKQYPFPWLAKAATPIYTRQIIEEMRLALVQGVMNQLWIFTIENPVSGEVGKLLSLLSANRAERTGFLVWRAGLKGDTYTPGAIEQLLLPELWWASTLDIFRRMGRTVRIVSGETAQRSGQGGGDAEIDTRVAQRKAMAHRNYAAQKIVMDLIRQWSRLDKSNSLNKALEEGKIRVNMTPIQLFLGEDLQKIWSPMWNSGMTSVRTIHAAIGVDTDEETALLEEEQKAGYEETYKARQQFAQRVATPSGEVTRSSEPGRPPGVQAAADDITPQVLTSFDEIDKGKDVEERRKRALAFIALLTALIRAHMRKAFAEGYAVAFGDRTVNEARLKDTFDWEQVYIVDFRDALLLKIDTGQTVQGERYRAELHPLAAYKRAYMGGVFQAKAEDGWMYWRRVLRPWASKSGPCQVCTDDSKVWHPITEPFWDHPYGVCSLQTVRFMRTSTDGWQSTSNEQVAVPLVNWEG